MRLLVTGATGFLGAAIADAAVATGLTVRGAGRRPRRSSAQEQVVLDLAERDDLVAAVEGVDIVVHAAGCAHVFGARALDAGHFDAVNAQGAAATANAAAEAGVKRFVLLSSVSVYGGGPWPGADEGVPPSPRTPYAASKLKGERLAAETAGRAGLELVCLRLATAYGSGDPGNVGRLIAALARGRFLWIGDGANRKSLIHRNDVARAVLLAARPGGPTGTFNVSGGTHSMRDIVGSACRALGRPEPSFHLPAGPMARLTRWAGLVGVTRPQRLIDRWLADDAYDGRRFERTFGFEPAVPLEDGMLEAVGSARPDSSRPS